MAGIRIASYADQGGAELALDRLRARDIDVASIDLVTVVATRPGRRRWWGGRGETVPGRVDVVARDRELAPTAEQELARWWDPRAVPVHVPAAGSTAAHRRPAARHGSLRGPVRASERRPLAT